MSLKLQFSDLYSSVSNFLGLTSYGVAPTGSNLTRCQDIVYRAYRRFLYPNNPRTGRRHVWSFLKTRDTITTESGTHEYDLASDFSEMIIGPVFSLEDGYTGLRKTDAYYIDNRRAMSNTTGTPELYAIVPQPFVELEGSEYKIWLWPTPDSEFTITYTYIADPPKPSAAADYLVGGVRTSEVLLELCYAVAEQQDEDMTTQHHTQLAQQLLDQAVVQDSIDNPDTLGRVLGVGRVFDIGRWRRGFEIDGSVYADDF